MGPASRRWDILTTAWAEVDGDSKRATLHLKGTVARD